MEQFESYEELERRRRERQLRKRRKKRRRIIVLILIIVLALVCVFVVPILRGPALPEGQTVTVSIAEGSNTRDIAAVLKDNGVISSELLFLIAVRNSEYYGKLRFGEFELQGGMDTSEVIEALATGGARKDTLSITIPEGYSIENIVQRCVENGLGTAEDYEAALAAEYDFAFIEYIPQKEGQKYRLQGFLFPSTYEFYKTASAEDVVKTMLAEFEKQYKTVADDFEGVYDVVNKAALIQRESKLESENARIAGVIENRLAADMRLQIDASVIYAVSDGAYDMERVMNSDLNVDSPYNTYRNKGLPVGPICNPGLAAIEGALHPEEHNYLYYHTDTTKNDGSHIFTETYDEHLATMN